MEEEEAICTPVQETPLTTCSLVSPSTAVSIGNLEYPEEPLPTAAFVANVKCPEMLPMALTESFYECPDVLKAADSNISPEPDSVVCVWTYIYISLASFILKVFYVQYIHISCMYVRLWLQCFQDRLRHTHCSAEK